MKKRRLGKSDIEITPIGLGTWQFSKGKGIAGGFWKSIDDEATTAVVKAALDGGIDWFDTARSTATATRSGAWPPRSPRSRWRPAR